MVAAIASCNACNKLYSVWVSDIHCICCEESAVTTCTITVIATSNTPHPKAEELEDGPTWLVASDNEFRLPFTGSSLGTYSWFLSVLTLSRACHITVVHAHVIVGVLFPWNLVELKPLTLLPMYSVKLTGRGLTHTCTYIHNFHFHVMLAITCSDTTTVSS